MIDERAPDFDAQRFFDAIARRYDRVYALSGATSRERLGRVLDAIHGRKRVLVLGIGTGRELPALLDAGHIVTGLDVSAAMLARCEARARTAPTVVGDFYAPLPFEDASFDAAVALHGTLAHPPREGALADLARELGRVLAPGGVVVAEVPAPAALAHAAAESIDGSRFVVTGPSTFLHVDEVAGVELAGVALDAAGWRDALGDALDVDVRPLGEAEHFVVATRRS